MLRFAGDLSGLSVPESRGACLACLGQKQGTHARRIPKKDSLGETVEEAHEAERKLVSLFLSSEEVEDGFISSVDSPMTKAHWQIFSMDHIQVYRQRKTCLWNLKDVTE
jgi:hypothetical protein